MVKVTIDLSKVNAEGYEWLEDLLQDFKTLPKSNFSAKYSKLRSSINYKIALSALEAIEGIGFLEGMNPDKFAKFYVVWREMETQKMAQKGYA